MLKIWANRERCMPSGSLTLRNAEAAHGVMYVVYFENVGSGKAAD